MKNREEAPISSEKIQRKLDAIGEHLEAALQITKKEYLVREEIDSLSNELLKVSYTSMSH